MNEIKSTENNTSVPKTYIYLLVGLIGIVAISVSVYFLYFKDKTNKNDPIQKSEKVSIEKVNICSALVERKCEEDKAEFSLKDNKTRNIYSSVKLKMSENKNNDVFVKINVQYESDGKWVDIANHNFDNVTDPDLMTTLLMDVDKNWFLGNYRINIYVSKTPFLPADPGYVEKSNNLLDSETKTFKIVAE